MPGDGMWIALGAAVVSLATLVLTALQVRIGAKHKEIAELTERIDRLEVLVKQCEEDRVRLTRENIDLMRRLLLLERES